MRAVVTCGSVAKKCLLNIQNQEDVENEVSMDVFLYFSKYFLNESRQSIFVCAQEGAF